SEDHNVQAHQPMASRTAKPRRYRSKPADHQREQPHATCSAEAFRGWHKNGFRNAASSHLTARRVEQGEIDRLMLLASSAAVPFAATITATWRRIRSAANSGSRVVSFCAQRNSTVRLRPSTYPVSFRPL